MSMSASYGQSEKINVKEWSSASELLTDSAKLIEAHGWQQGATEAVPQECVATALEKAFRAKADYSLVDLNYARAVLNEQIGAHDVPVVLKMDVKDEPAVPYWGVEYMDWNDAKGRTKEDVIRTLQNAAGRAAELSKQAATK